MDGEIMADQWEEAAKAFKPAPTAPGGSTPAAANEDWKVWNAGGAGSAAKPPYKSDLRKVPVVGGVLGSIDENFVTPGIDQMAGGFNRVLHPNDPSSTPTRQILGGVSQVGRGAARGMGPAFLAQGLATAPFKTLAGLTAAIPTGGVVNAGSRMAGASPEVSDFLGDAFATAAGMAGAGIAGGIQSGTRAQQDALLDVPVFGRYLRGLRNAYDPPRPVVPAPAVTQPLGAAPSPRPVPAPAVTQPLGSRVGPPASVPAPPVTQPLGSGIAPRPIVPAPAVTQPLGSVAAPTPRPVPAPPVTQPLGSQEPSTRFIQHLGDMRINGRTPAPPKFYDSFGRELPPK